MTMKCAICGEEIYEWGLGKAKHLQSGEMVCGYCLEESCEIVQCYECNEWLWAKDATKYEKDIHCAGCIECEIENLIDEYIYTLDEFMAEEPESYELSTEGYMDYVDDRAQELELPRKMAQRLIDRIDEEIHAA
jgi:hypothetical protein